MAKKKTKVQLGVLNGFLLADAQRVLKASKKHWRLLVRLGFTEDDRRKLEELIALVRAQLGTAPGPVTLESERNELHELLRAYRASAAFVAERPGHSDANANRLLKPFGEFPARDSLLKSYIEGLPAAMQQYAAELTARGFPRDQQTALNNAIAAFLTAFKKRGTLLGEAELARKAIEASINELRQQVSYLRRGGHSALYGQTASSDFDRLHARIRAGKKKAPAPNPAGGAAPRERTTAGA